MALLVISAFVLLCGHIILAQPFPRPGFGPGPGPGGQPPFGFGPGGPGPMGPIGPGGPDFPPFGPGGTRIGQQPGFNSDPYQYATCYFNQTMSMIRGRVDVRQLVMGGLMQVRVQVVGLPRSRMSDTEHGLHVHQFGDTGRLCYKTGPHFDTDAMSFHGPPSGVQGTTNHDGDWGNFRQTNDGVIDRNFTTQMIIEDIAGRAIVLHEGRDDLGRGGNPISLQTGNSGRALSCCAIGYADSTNWNLPFISNLRNGFRPGFTTDTGFNGNDQFNQGFSNTGTFGTSDNQGQFNNGQFNTGMAG